jgi:hypothetical protein
MGNYDGKCPNKNKKKYSGIAVTTKEDAFASHFQRECSLIVCFSTTESPSRIWYIESGASIHVSCQRELH